MLNVQSCTDNLPISAVTANGYQYGYPPSNVLVNSLSTRWSNPGITLWIRTDLGTTKSICSGDIAWCKGMKEDIIMLLPHPQMALQLLMK
jgi:hypothetical protein